MHGPAKNMKNISLSSLATPRMILKREGKEWKGLCPFHKEDTPSFTIYTTADGIERFKCFGCGANGSGIDFVSKFDKISYSEARKRISELSQWESGKEITNESFKSVLSKTEKKIFPLSDMLPAEEELANSIEGQE